MSFIQHHAIIVTSVDRKLLTKAYKKAFDIFDWISPMSPDMINGWASFFIPPDGSSEGWQQSTDGDNKREKFIKWIEKQRDKDGTTSLDYCEVQYGGDSTDDKVLQSTNVIGDIV